MLAILSAIWPFSNDNETLGDAGAVFDAISERSDFGFRYVGTFGEPDVVNRGGNYTDDYHVIIPFYTEDPNDPDPANLEYDLPDGMEDAEAEFYEVLERFGITDLSQLGDVEGKNVPLDFEDGTLVPLWEEVLEITEDE